MTSHYTIAFQHLQFLSLLVSSIIISQSHSTTNSCDYLALCKFLFIALVKSLNHNELDDVYALNYSASTLNN